MKEAIDATGMIEAQSSFRRIRDHPQMAVLVTVNGHTVIPVAPANYAQADA